MGAYFSSTGWSARAQNKQHRGLSGLASLATVLPLTYRSNKYIRVDVPLVAVIHRSCQLVAVLIALAQLYFEDGWAVAEEPGGMANAWVETGNMLVATDDTTLSARTTYCSNPSYSYVEGIYAMAAPECRGMMTSELITKTTDSAFVTTAFSETVTIGWPCEDVDATGSGAYAAATGASAEENEATCAASNGTLFNRSNGQCGCQDTRAYYPLAVEQLSMSLEHAFDTSTAFGDWEGSSVEAAGGSGLETFVVFKNGTTRKFNAGEVMAMPLSAWFNIAGVDLDAKNQAVRRDDRGNLPPMRTTGVNVRVDILYSNVDRATKRPATSEGRRDVHAEVKLRPEYGTWTGVGVQAIWVVFPADQDDSVPQHYHLVERTRQGVLFQFHTSGLIYKFDFWYLLSVAIAALVMVKSADVVADTVAFYMLPGGQSTVLLNKRSEIVSKRSEFAEIGMKAAILACSYRNFDPDNNGIIEAVDIVRVFAHVEGITWQQAHAIAHMIMAGADTSFQGEEAGSEGGLSFIEYMTCVEGDAINFADFLANVEPAKGTSDEEDCRLAFEDERKSLPLKKGRMFENMPAAPVLGQSLNLTNEQKQERLGNRGVLRVHFERASGLKSTDTNGLSDPYAMAVIKRVHVKTKALPKTLAPAWNEMLQFKVTPQLQAVVDVNMTVSVMDKDTGMLDKDDEVGKCTVALSALAECDSITFAEALTPQGVIYFTVSWTEGEASPFKKKKGGEASPVKKVVVNGTGAGVQPSPMRTRSPSPTPPAPPPPPAESEASASAAASASPKKKKKKKSSDEEVVVTVVPAADVEAQLETKQSI